MMQEEHPNSQIIDVVKSLTQQQNNEANNFFNDCLFRMMSVSDSNIHRMQPWQAECRSMTVSAAHQQIRLQSSMDCASLLT